jgi:hypothetical protein
MVPDFNGDGGKEIGIGNPNRAVPRVTTFELSTRFSIGTRIGDGVGGAVRAAASAGDSMRDPAAQPASATTVTIPKAYNRTVVRFLFMISLCQMATC